MIREKTAWTYYMTWSHDFGMTERFTTNEVLRRNYQSGKGVTLSKLPELYHVNAERFAVMPEKKEA